MKKLCYILFLLPSLIFAQGDTSELKTEVKEVTVFFAGAEVHREGKLELAKGKHTLMVEGLPANLESQTLQVEGMSGINILSVKQEKSRGKSKKDDKAYKKVEGQIDSLRTNIQKINNEIYALKVEEKLLMDNSQFGGAEKGAEIDELKQASEFYRKRLLSIQNEIIDLKLMIKQINNAISDKYEELNKRFVNKDKAYTRIYISLECESAKKEELHLSYYIPTAGWTPTYDFRVKEITDPLKIVYNANVFQSSGEDWNKVALTLSSNNPSISGIMPEMNKWIVGRKTDFNSDYPDYSMVNDVAQDGISSLSGRIIDEETEEPIPFANVTLLKNGENYLATTTDFDGVYNLKPIEPAYYDLQVSYIGYPTQRISDLLIKEGRINHQDVYMEAGIMLEEVVISEYSKPLFEKDQSTVKYKRSREEIQNMAVRSASDIGRTAGNGTFSRDDGVNVRGARGDNQVTFIDGIKVIGSTDLPRSQIAYSEALIDFEKNASELSLEYAIKVPYTIPSDGKDYNIQIKEERVPVDYEYHVLPRFDKEAFLLVNLSNWEELDLLSGKASIYYRGTYTGETYINSQSTEDTLGISLGRDKQIIVSRDEDKELDNRQVFSNNIKETVAWEIVVKNNKQFPVKLIIKDQYPLSDRKDITAELLNAEGAEIDDKKGFLRWEFELVPGAKKELGFSYEVKYPRYGEYLVR